MFLRAVMENIEEKEHFFDIVWNDSYQHNDNDYSAIKGV